VLRSEIVDTLHFLSLVPADGDVATVGSGELRTALCLTTPPGVVVVSAAFAAYSITGTVTQT
jgi:hypothetical protein